MPFNQEFVLEILVGKQVVPEYEKDGQVYIECNLSTPVSYAKTVTETVGSEIESQPVPVTPYQIRLHAQLQAPRYYYKVFVDGVKVKAVSLQGGQSCLIPGFKDGSHIREFLFTLPRFSRDEHDKVQGSRWPAIGKVEVECWNAILNKSGWKVRMQPLNYEQASKKDNYNVTNGQYTMVTSGVGQVVGSRHLFRNVDHWKRVSVQSKLSVQYHMAHTLQDMGFEIRPMPTITAAPSTTLSRKLSKISRKSKKRKSAKNDVTDLKRRCAEIDGVKTAAETENGGTTHKADTSQEVEIKDEQSLDTSGLNNSCVEVAVPKNEPSEVIDLTV